MSDKNKGITSILYTHLNMPYEINIAGKGKIIYQYDNLGNKLKKTVIDNTVTPARTTTWMYIHNFVYKNDTMQFFTHEEGRARYDVTEGTGEAKKFDFDYFLKDHLGNVRMVLTEEKDTSYYPAATIEDATRPQETLFYNIVTAQVKDKAQVANAGSISSFGSKLYKVHGGLAGQKTGLGIVLKVMAGDTVAIHAESFYNLPGTGAGDPLQLALPELLSAFTGSGALSGKGLSPTTVAGIGGNTSSLTSFLNTSTGTTAADAHLNWVLFDDQFKYVTGDVDPVKSGGGHKSHTKFINTPAQINKSGYLYIFVSNKSNLEVYFDNLVVTHRHGPIMEETHYYPFGLTLAGISSRALGRLENKIKFTGQELDSDLELNWYQFRYRTMDPQIGRFLQIDPLAVRYVYNSTYAYAENDVINSIDLEGLERGPVRYLSPSTNYTQNKRMYREVNSYVPRAGQYRSSATYIPNQGSGSAPTPANIYEPFVPGTGEQSTGPFITRGNTIGRLGTAMTEMIDDLKGQIDRVQVTTDKKVTGVTSSVMSEKVSITWKTQDAENAFNELQAGYDQQVQSIRDNNKLPAPPGAGASQQDWDNWLSESKSIMQKSETQMSLLGPSPTQQILRSVVKPDEFIRTNTDRSTLSSISQGSR